MNVSPAENLLIAEDSVAEQEETRKASRMRLKELQNVSTQKENFHPRSPFVNAMPKELLISSVKGPTEPKRTKTLTSKSTQTTTEEENDITAVNPGEHYWQKLAESRRVALEEALEENLDLRVDIERLESSIAQTQTVIADLKGLVETLTEMVGESSGSKESDSKQEDDSGIAPCVDSDNSDD